MLDILMQRCRNKVAAKKFLKKLLKKQGYAPRLMVTDKLKSYAAAKKEILPSVEYRQHKGLNNRVQPDSGDRRFPMAAPANRATSENGFVQMEPSC